MTAVMEFLGEVTLDTTEPHRVGPARREIRDLAAKLLADPVRLDDTELLAAEVITNAILYGTPPVVITVAYTGRGVAVEVRDNGPADEDTDPRGDHGRGLEIVQALASRFRIDTGPGRTDGTCVTFEIDLDVGSV